MLFELKKELGESGEEQAQQLRKAAALLRKWYYEILGIIPEIELYFAAGAASSFVASGFSYNSEVGKNVQNWTNTHIRSQVVSARDHIKYIRTPVYLLTAQGFADLIRIEDDILITKTGYELLSVSAPRKREDIEKLMKEKSVLEGFIS